MGCMITNSRDESESSGSVSSSADIWLVDLCGSSKLTEHIK